MKFGPVPLADATGKILGHNVAGPDGQRVLRKGRLLAAADVALLAGIGRTSVYVAELEADDVDENSAADRLVQAVTGPGLRPSRANTGRSNLYATQLGLVRVDVARLAALNACPGVTLATLPPHMAVQAGRMAATLKILPYALPEPDVRAAALVAATPFPLLHIDPLPHRSVGLILSGSLSTESRTRDSFGRALRTRLEKLGASVDAVDFVPLEDETGEYALAATINRQHAAGRFLIILAGETAIQDRYDIAPRAIERAGGRIECYGAPVDPGNLLLLAYRQDRPILGAPGCARSPKDNIVDLVLPRLLAGDHLTQADILAFGPGGLLEDAPERPLPRSRLT